MKFPKKEIFTLMLWILGFVILIYSMPFLFNFFQPIIIGGIISLIVYPMVHFLENKFKIIKPFGMTIVSVIIILIIVVSGYFIIGFIYEEILNLISDIPDIYKNIEKLINNFLEYLKDYSNKFPFLTQYVQTLENFEIELPNVNTIANYIAELSNSFFIFAKSLPDLIINFVFVCLFAILFTLKGNNIRENLDKTFNNKKRKNDIYLIFVKLKNILSGYISAQLKLLLITFIIVFIGFNIINIEYIFLMSIIISILDMLPVFGTGTILGPYAVISFISGEYKIGIGCVIIYLITFIVRRAIEPKLVGESVGVSSLFSVFCMFIGYRIMGLIGLVLGIPIGVIILYLYKLEFFKNLINSLISIKNYIKNLINN